MFVQKLEPWDLLKGFLLGAWAAFLINFFFSFVLILFGITTEFGGSLLLRMGGLITFHHWFVALICIIGGISGAIYFNTEAGKNSWLKKFPRPGLPAYISDRLKIEGRYSGKRIMIAVVAIVIFNLITIAINLLIKSQN